jgi:arylsulfatase A-like enzyme
MPGNQAADGRRSLPTSLSAAWAPPPRWRKNRNLSSRPFTHPAVERGRLAPALRVGLAHGAMAVLVQLESAAHLLPQLHLGPWGAARFLAEIPFLQLQNLAVAAALTLVAYLCAGHRLLRPLPHLLLFLLNGLLVIDQLVWNVFLSHLDVTPGDLPWRSLTALRSSAWAVAGWELAANLTALAVLSLWVWRSDAGQPRWTAAGRRWAAAWMAGVAVVTILADGHHLEEHPLIAILRGAGSRWRGEKAGGASVPLATLYPLRFDRVTQPVGEDDQLRDVLTRLRRLQRPNVLLVVLESVGAKQLFTEGHIEARLTPRLADALRTGVAFTAVYTTFPGTTRAHISLETGGATLTWGDFNGARGAAYPLDNAATAFSRLGYDTAVFSASEMAPQYLDDLLFHQGYDLVFDPQRAPQAWRTAHAFSSWGYDEDAVREQVNTWLDTPRRRPWFVQLLTNSTHHPYLVPKQPFTHDLQTRYRLALAYTDAVLGRLIDDLARSGRLQNTVILVTGDHGESFGSFHLTNFGHRNFIYEENVRSFLLVLAPPALAGRHAPVISDRVASLGDVVPTILGALDQPAPGMNGESIWPDAYRPRIVYFFKDTRPAQWGSRDGRWKFIGRQAGAGERDKQAELYDLRRDPDEQANLATVHPELALFYDRLCRSWYASAGADFAARSRH